MEVGEWKQYEEEPGKGFECGQVEELMRKTTSWAMKKWPVIKNIEWQETLLGPRVRVYKSQSHFPKLTLIIEKMEKGIIVLLCNLDKRAYWLWEPKLRKEGV